MAVGMEITCSAPRSFGLYLALGRDEELERAVQEWMQEALRQTLARMEDRLC
jgi:hypothetical protein